MSNFATSFLLLLQAVSVEGGTIHPMNGASPYIGNVVVVDGVIASVGATTAKPEDAQVIDAKGLHVIPGLIDGMVHHDGEHDELYVRAGVVLARDLGNDMGRILIARAHRRRAEAVGPRLFISGAVLDGVPPVTTKAVIVRNREEAEAKMPRLIDLKVDFISTHLGISREALSGAAGLAHGAGLKLWGHVPRGLKLEESYLLGLDGVVGMEAFLSDRFQWVGVDEPDTSIAVQVATSPQRFVMPVINAFAARVRRPEDPDGALSLMGPHYTAQWSAELNAREVRGGADYYQLGGLALKRQMDLLADLYGAGAQLLPGSGAPNPWVTPGDGLHDELSVWVEAGIPPEEVLRAATYGAARILGVSGKYGSISTGLLGDLIVVDSDPRLGLDCLRRPRWVVLRGAALSAAHLEGRVEDLRGRQAEQRLASSRELLVEAPDVPEGDLLLSGFVQTDAFGQRVGGERYAVVRLPDGQTTYCSRSVVPATAAEAASHIQFSQTLKGKVVSSFDFLLESYGTKIQIRGTRVGGQLRVERRVDNQFLDTSSSTEPVNLVDSGSVTAALIAAHHLSDGPIKALYFEDLEPAVVNWTYEVKPSGVHAFLTGEGPLVALFRPDGGLDKMERTRGSGVIRQFATSTDLHGGAGLPLPAESLPPAKAAPESEGERVGGVEAGD
jgi:imidazolonepropionase-like amidohydrolase